MRRLLVPTCLFLTACGSSNFNSILVGKAEKESIDQKLLEAQNAYDKGNYDEAIKLSSEIERVYAFSESALIIKSNSYMSKAGFDAFELANNLISQSDSKNTNNSEKSGDTTTDNLSALSTIIGLTSSDLEALSDGKDSPLNLVLYRPKSRTAARAAPIDIIQNLSLAIEALCPLLPSSPDNDANAGKPKDPTKDPRHNCESTDEPMTKSSQTKLTWALAHLAEAVTFYSVVLYTEAGQTAPNITRVSSALDPKKPQEFIQGLNLLANSIDAIFPTGAKAPDSMLNGLFNDLKITSYSFSDIAGVPSSVTKSIDDSIKNLESKIQSVSKLPTGSSPSAEQQNEGLRNALTTATAKKLADSIKTIPEAQKKDACDLFAKINSDPSLKPQGC